MYPDSNPRCLHLRIRLRLLFRLLLIGLTAITFHTPAHSQTVSDLQWLTGLWKGTETGAVFENPEHDFPNRIVYELENERTLRITISGIDDGATTQSFWMMEKARLSSGE